MLSFPAARDLLLQHTPVLASEQCRIEQAVGRVLRSAIQADRPFPSFDRVMMDGYALRSTDLRMRRPFQVTGTAPAGQPMAALANAPFTCVEVMTGAPLPAGADCIVPVEEVSRPSKDEVSVAGSYEPIAGRFIHRAGSDAAAGAILLGEGCLLGSREIGVAASCGAGWLEVSELPKVGVFATGDELVAVDSTPADHQLRQSNGHAITTALHLAGYPTRHFATLGDDVGAAEIAIRACLATCNWLVLTGAVSKGSRDFVPALLDGLGCIRLFHGVAQRPGKPAGCWIGPAGQVIMALPGNPVSALTGLHAFVLPALAVASGLPVPRPRAVILDGHLPGLPGMTNHLPVKLGADGRARPAATGNSGDFIGLLASDGFITMPPRGELAAAFPFTPWL
jgi:molybdopterin molybdotransferase